MLRWIVSSVGMAEPNIDSTSLKEKIKASKSPVVKHDFGLALGSIYFIKPDPSQFRKSTR